MYLSCLYDSIDAKLIIQSAITLHHNVNNNYFSEISVANML